MHSLPLPTTRLSLMKLGGSDQAMTNLLFSAQGDPDARALQDSKKMLNYTVPHSTPHGKTPNGCR